MTFPTDHVPSPADAPTMTAAELVERIRSDGGRLLRMQEPPSAFVLTDRRELAEWLQARGARMVGGSRNGSYKRTRGGKVEWDLWVHSVPVLGDETVWELAAR